MTAPTECDLVIMRTDILDFTVADPKDYFRVSECSAIVARFAELDLKRFHSRAAEGHRVSGLA